MRYLRLFVPLLFLLMALPPIVSADAPSDAPFAVDIDVGHSAPAFESTAPIVVVDGVPDVRIAERPCMCGPDAPTRLMPNLRHLGSAGDVNLRSPLLTWSTPIAVPHRYHQRE